MTKKYSDDLCKLVIENIEQYENTAKVLKEIEETLFTTMDKEIENAVDRNMEEFKLDLIKGKDATEFDFNENPSLFFTINNWKHNEKSIVRFEVGPDVDVDYNWLTHMSGLMDPMSYLGVWIKIDRRALGLQAREFKQKLKAQYEAYPKLAEEGFMLNSSGEYIFRKFNFDLQEIADNYPDNLADAMKPAIDSIDALFKVMSDVKLILDYFHQSIKHE